MNAIKEAILMELLFTEVFAVKDNRVIILTQAGNKALLTKKDDHVDLHFVSAKATEDIKVPHLEMVELGRFLRKHKKLQIEWDDIIERSKA